MMKYLLPLVCITLLAVEPSAASGVNAVTLKEKAFVSGEYIHLNDIADIAGPGREKLSSISIMRSPSGPLEITLSSAFVAGRIKEHTPEPVVMNGSTNVRVSERYVEISGKELERIYREAILKNSPWEKTGNIMIESIKTPRCFRVPAKHRSAIQANFSSREDFLGYTPATLSAGTGTTAATCQVSGKVRVITEVPVARTNIPRGAVIADADLEMKHLDISSYPSVVREKKECLGMRAKSTLREGRPVLRTNVEQPPMINRGDPVFIEARIGNLLIRDKGIALKDGFLQERIPVKNAASGRQVFGTVIAASRIEVMF